LLHKPLTFNLILLIQITVKDNLGICVSLYFTRQQVEFTEIGITRRGSLTYWYSLMRVVIHIQKMLAQLIEDARNIGLTAGCNGHIITGQE